MPSAYVHCGVPADGIYFAVSAITSHVAVVCDPLRRHSSLVSRLLSPQRNTMISTVAGIPRSYSHAGELIQTTSLVTHHTDGPSINTQIEYRIS